MVSSTSASDCDSNSEQKRGLDLEKCVKLPECLR